MATARLILCIGLLSLMAGCRGQAPNAQSRQNVGPHAVATFPVTVNGADKEVTLTVTLRSEGVPVEAYLVLEKDSREVTELLRNGQPAGNRILAKAEGKGAKLTVATPARSGIYIVIRNPSDKQAIVTWEVSH